MPFGPPTVRMFQWEKFSAVQSIPNDVLTTVTGWEAAQSYGDGDLSRGFDPTTGLYTIQRAGVYEIAVDAVFAASAVGYRQVSCNFGVTAFLPPGLTVAAQVGTAWQFATAPGFAEVGTTSQPLRVRQNSGAPLDLTYAMFCLSWLGP